MQLCEYGCGKEAKYQFKNGKWCCSKNFNSCSNVRKNMRETRECSKETKDKMSLIRSGKNNPMYGKQHSIETRNKISNTLIGFKHTEETRTKMSKSHIGKIISLEQLEKRRKTMIGFKHSNETKKKISESKQGHEPWNKGMKNIYSDETIQSIKTTLKLSINQYKKRYQFFSKIEEMRYNPDKLGEKEIQVHCKNHNCINSKEKDGWFTPTYIQFYERIRCIENGNGGSYFYCCDECKQECPLFNLHSDPNEIKEELYTSEEYQTWRQEVLKRANYLCEYCEEKATHVHHSRPQKLEPGFILDPDFGIACCEKCHYKYGHKTGTECSTGNLANTICN